MSSRKKDKFKMTRRQVLKAGLIGGAGMMMPWRFMLAKANAVALGVGLSDPALQPKFQALAPNALDPGFMYTPAGGKYTVGVGQIPNHDAGLISTVGGVAGASVRTPAWGYGQNGVYTWPGKTFQVQRGQTTTTVEWQNNLGHSHLLPVDTSLHWCYSLQGYTGYSIATNGVPIITHLHGGHTDFQYDGNPEFFYNPDGTILGPQWAAAGYGSVPDFVYDNDVPAGNLWYHDHALGITRLNVYAGLAGFYFVRDANDTGAAGNPLTLPAEPYELAYAIQDRMFTDTGALFYPAFQGDPFWVDFITPQIEANLAASGLFGTPPNLGPSALAEFFGDHMVVNGKIWPFTPVEPRDYRMRLLNGCDSRFLAVRFRAVPAGATNLKKASRPIPFWVIGSDQGLAAAATQVDQLLIEPGGRWDIVFDFSDPALAGKRVIMENIGPDAPFGGLAGAPSTFFPDRQTDRIMAFDVGTTVTGTPVPFDPTVIAGGPNVIGTPGPTPRRLALFEGTDEYGRLQPLLGSAGPTVNVDGTPVDGSIAWHSPTTENPALDSTEIWEIYNATADAHPIHLHLVHFEIIDRQKFKADLIPQPVEQHNGATGGGFRLANIKLQGKATPALPEERAPKDMVTIYPGEVARIKATFDKPGRYVWHCHILSHEDHEMMRVLQVKAV